MRYRTWNLMLLGAAVCAAASVYLVWRVTVTGDLSLERFIRVLVVLGITLFGGGYLLENRRRRHHPEESPAAWPLS